MTSKNNGLRAWAISVALAPGERAGLLFPGLLVLLALIRSITGS